MSNTFTEADLRDAVPDTSTDQNVAGLDDVVEVHRDSRGIPHVRAQTTHDAFFGQAFATAQDRLWHMDYDRRRAYGRWAEVAGPAGLDQDRLMRRFQLAPSAAADYAVLGDETKSMLDAYAAGVNAFIQGTDRLPIEYLLIDRRPELWQPWDCLAVFKVRHILMGTFESKLWRARLVNAVGPERAAAVLRGYQPGHLLILPPGVKYDGAVLDGLEDLRRGLESIDWLAEAEAGSNSWVLSGSRTDSGRPLVAGDPHRALDTPNVYYQNHVACPQFDVVGLSFPGFPGFPHYGHNERVAWCVTHAMADYQDLYVERFKRGDSTRYEWQGGWRQAEVRDETIGVKDSAVEELSVTITHHGPIVAGDPADGYGIALRYTGADPARPSQGCESILPMLRCSDVDELEESMRTWVDPCNNFVFADVAGNIGYLCRGEVPVRSRANAWLPVPGWDGEHEWHERVPFEEMPRSRNPSSGYIVTANNRIVGHDFPHYIGLDYAPEFRARPIVAIVDGMEQATAADMAKIHALRSSIPAERYQDLLTRIESVDDISAEALRHLRTWNGSMDGDQVAPTIYSAFRLQFDRAAARLILGSFADTVFADSEGPASKFRTQFSALFVRMVGNEDTSLLSSGIDWADVAATALSDGLTDLRSRLGDDMESWVWRMVHRTSPRHPLSDVVPDAAEMLDPPQVSIEGDGDTPLRSSFALAEPFLVTATSVARYVFDLSDWSKCRWVTPLGSSGHPGSPHYADQAKLWSEVQLIPMLYDWGQISAAAESRQSLSPIGK